MVAGRGAKGEMTGKPDSRRSTPPSRPSCRPTGWTPCAATRWRAPLAGIFRRPATARCIARRFQSRFDRWHGAHAKPASSDWVGDRRRLSARPGGTACRRSYRRRRVWQAGQDGTLRVDRIPLFRERMMIAMPRDHRLAGHPSIRFADLAGVPQVRHSRCEYNELVARLFRQHRIDCEIAFDSPRDDWALALIARGLGFVLMPQHSIDHPGVLSRPLVEPTLWREASLFTCRERANGDGLDALVQEAAGITAASAAVPHAGDSLADDAR